MDKQTTQKLEEAQKYFIRIGINTVCFLCIVATSFMVHYNGLMSGLLIGIIMILLFWYLDTCKFKKAMEEIDGKKTTKNN